MPQLSQPVLYTPGCLGLFKTTRCTEELVANGPAEHLTMLDEPTQAQLHLDAILMAVHCTSLWHLNPLLTS